MDPTASPKPVEQLAWRSHRASRSTPLAAVWLALALSLAAPRAHAFLEAPVPVPSPLDEDKVAVLFTYAGMASGASYGLWMAWQTGSRAVAFLLDYGLSALHVEPLQATEGASVGFSTQLDLGLKVRLWSLAERRGARALGMTIQAKAFSSLTKVWPAGSKLAYDVGGVAGLSLVWALPAFWIFRVELQPYVEMIPAIWAHAPPFAGLVQTAYLRFGSAIQIEWDKNPTPLLVSAGALASLQTGTVPIWFVGLGLTF